MDPPTVGDVSARLHNLQMGSHNSEMTAMEPSAVNDLSARLQKIPQELQDEIFEFTIAICTTRETGSVVTISRDWRPPWQMQINKASRNRVAKRYFSDNIFLLPPTQGPNGLVLETAYLSGAWLAALTTDHVARIEEIRVPHFADLTPNWQRLLRTPSLSPPSAIIFINCIIAQIEGTQEILEMTGKHQLQEGCVKVGWKFEVKGSEKREEGTIGDADEGIERDGVKFERRWYNAKGLKAALEEMRTV